MSMTNFANNVFNNCTLTLSPTIHRLPGEESPAMNGTILAPDPTTRLGPNAPWAASTDAIQGKIDDAVKVQQIVISSRLLFEIEDLASLHLPPEFSAFAKDVELSSAALDDLLVTLRVFMVRYLRHLKDDVVFAPGEPNEPIR